MSVQKWDRLWLNASIITGNDADSVIENGAVASKGGLISWVGAVKDLPDDAAQLAGEVLNMNGYCITPGLIDCHTHLVYAGNRANEFEMRLKGMSYVDIARQGGGIQSTVRATRQASEDQLLEQSLPRARALQNSGVTTVEIKSGYGLDWETEKKMLRVAKRIGETLPLTVKRTFLGAHSVAPEYKGKAQDYVNLVCNEMIPKVSEEKLADAVDVFCENIAFDVKQTEQVFTAAKKYHLAVKCHGEQLSCSQSTELAAKYAALSVDHLEFASAKGIRAMAASGTIAVVLPGAFYFLRETKMPPIDKIREAGVKMAVASDCNPGTSPIMSLLTIMNMACTIFRMTPEEVMQGVTKNAAIALGIEDKAGTLTVGKSADLAIWNAKSAAELIYYIGNQPLVQLVKAGEIING